MSSGRSCHKKVPVGSKDKRRNGEMSYLVSCTMRPKVLLTTFDKREVFPSILFPKSDNVFMSQGYTFGLHPRATQKSKKFPSENCLLIQIINLGLKLSLSSGTMYYSPQKNEGFFFCLKAL